MRLTTGLSCNGEPVADSACDVRLLLSGLERDKTLDQDSQHPRLSSVVVLVPGFVSHAEDTNVLTAAPYPEEAIPKEFRKVQRSEGP